MGHSRVVYAIAESRPLDALLVRDMKRAVGSLLQLNLQRFRVPEKATTHYSALDVMKQALELLYEFAPSQRSYREAMRTIQVYSEGDDEMLRTLRASFKLIANAVYNAYSGQRHVESIAPEILFLQGIPFEQTELQQSFRFVGVRPPDVSPRSVKKTVFLDDGFEPYKLLLQSKITYEAAERGREEYWARRISSVLSGESGTALIRVSKYHVDPKNSAFHKIADKIHPQRTGKLQNLLRQRGIELRIVDRIGDVNQAFGRE
jgi:hypothetical protein